MKSNSIMYLLIGLLLGVSLMFFSGAFGSMGARGRYSLHVDLPIFFVLDTHTGTVETYMTISSYEYYNAKETGDAERTARFISCGKALEYGAEIP